MNKINILFEKINSLNPIWYLVFFVLFTFFFNLGEAPLFDVDEGAFTEATREMFERNDFMTTCLNGSTRYDKPILIYWLQALSIKITRTS